MIRVFSYQTKKKSAYLSMGGITHKKASLM